MYLLLTYNVFSVIIKKPHIVNITPRKEHTTPVVCLSTFSWGTICGNMVHNRTWKIVRTKDSIDVVEGNKKFLTVTANEIITNYPATDGGVTTEMKELLATFFGENVEHAVGLGGLKTEKALINCVFTCTYEKK